MLILETNSCVWRSKEFCCCCCYGRHFKCSLVCKTNWMRARGITFPAEFWKTKTKIVFRWLCTGLVYTETIIHLHQERIRGQRGTLPIMALGYVTATKVIFRSGRKMKPTSALLPHSVPCGATNFRRRKASLKMKGTGIFRSTNL